MSHIPQVSMITSSERPMEVTAHFTSPVGPRHPGGVLVASGDRHGGYSFYVKDGRLCFEHVMLGQRVELSGSLQQGMRRCSLVLHVAGDRSATAILFSDRMRPAEIGIPLVSSHLSFWGLDIDRDTGIAVSDRYEGPFVFPDTDLDRVVVRFFEELTAQEIAAALEAAE